MPLRKIKMGQVISTHGLGSLVMMIDLSKVKILYANTSDMGK